jgi:hypothetical protein
MTDREEIRERIVDILKAKKLLNWTTRDQIFELEALLVQARKQVVEDVLGLIGPDEEPNPEIWKPDYVRTSQNLLRATLREEIQGAFGGNTVSAPAHKKHVDKLSEEAE